MIVLSHHAAANILCGDHGGAADTGTSPMRHSAEIVCHQYKRPLWSDISDHRRACESRIRYGFVTNVERDQIPPGLSGDIIRAISEKKHEPEWMLEWRLKAYRFWKTMTEPTWHNVHFPPIDYQTIVYYSAPKKKPGLNSLDEVDPEIKATFDKLGIPLEEQKLMAGVAVDAVFDSVSVATTFKEKLAELGVIFGSFSEAVQDHPDLVRKYLTRRSMRRCSATVRSPTSPKVCGVRWSCPRTFVSTPRRQASLNAPC